MRKYRFTFMYVMASVVLGCAVAWAAPEGHFVPLNPDFLSSRNGSKERNASAFAVGDFKRGVFPGPIDWGYLQGAQVGGSNAALPAKFDLEEEGRLTGVLSQGKWGTCWAFASMESVESSLLSATGDAYDLSELNLAWFAYYDERPAKPGYTSHVTEPSENPVLDNGGVMMLEQVTALFSRGTGPAYESDAPYPHVPEEEVASYVPNPLPYAPARFRLKEAVRFTDIGNIKKALVDTGGLLTAIGIHAGYCDDERGRIYTPKPLEVNHAVMLVGWDDTYPRTNFETPEGLQPLGDGAWKIQNSWGTQAGNRGYYWVSYEDRTFLVEQGAAAFTMEPVENYDGIYFHDPLGVCALWERPSNPAGVSIANAFTADRDEKIVSVGFVTANTNMAYEIQVYKNLESGGAPDSGEPFFEVPQKGAAGATGYRSVVLNETVPLAKGERFAIVVTLRNSNSSEPADKIALPVEVAVSGYSDKATVSEGESYLKSAGIWKDAFFNEESIDDDDDNDEGDPFNLCVKAFTVGTPSSDDSSSSGCNAGGAFGAAVLLLGFYWSRLSRTPNKKR